MNNKTEFLHISQLMQGDTVVYRGEPETVSKKNITKGFTGWCYKGDPHHFEKGMLEVVLYPKWKDGEIVSWVRQK